MKFVLLLVVVTVLAAHLVEAKKEDGEKGKRAEHRPATQEKSADHKPAQADGARTRRDAPADAGNSTERKYERRHKSHKGKENPKE